MLADVEGVSGYAEERSCLLRGGAVGEEKFEE